MIRASVIEELKMSVNWSSKKVELSETTTGCILRKDWASKPYKVQITGKKPLDHSKRRAWVNWVRKQPADFSQNNHLFIMKHILTLVNILINKIVLIVARKFHQYILKSLFIHDELGFDVRYGGVCNFFDNLRLLFLWLCKKWV